MSEEDDENESKETDECQFMLYPTWSPPENCGKPVFRDGLCGRHWQLAIREERE